MFSEDIKLSGEVKFTLIDENGNVKLETPYMNNMIVQVGKNYIASRIASNNSSFMSYMAVGTSNANSSIAMTSLQAEPANSRAQLVTATATANVIAFAATFNPGIGTGALTEAGIFDSGTANSGTMLSRITFPVITKQASDTITINWNVKIN